MNFEKNGIWFVYDGECPLCTAAARVLRIKQDYGMLYLINAREAENHPLVKEITLRGLDLDEGMVIYTPDRFYHGKDALKFMARYGDAGNFMMVLCKAVFRSEFMSTLAYPWMRRTRNLLLRRKGIKRINNLRG